MFFRISAFYRFLISTCLCAWIFLTACEPVTINVPISTPPSTCASPTPETNPYLSHPLLPEMTNIYSKIYTDLAGARQDALSQLGKNTQHWSDQVNIATDDTHMVRIMITYLDPVLIQYIVLNDVLNSYIPNGPSTPPSTDYLNYRLSNAMQTLGKRNELLFLVTITSPFYREQAYNNTVLTVQLPIEQLELVNTADVRVIPAHEDHILDENMDISHGPISGIVGYPLEVQNKTECTRVTDEFTTTLTLDIPSVTMGSNAPFGVQFWRIPFQPLVTEKDIHLTPTYDPYYASNPVYPLATPPTPYWEPNAQTDHTDWTAYWNDMGRYIWNVVITESLH